MVPDEELGFQNSLVNKGGKERMKVSKIIFGIFLFLMGFIYTSTAFSLDKEQEKEFQRIGKMSVRELTATAKAATSRFAIIPAKI